MVTTQSKNRSDTRTPEGEGVVGLHPYHFSAWVNFLKLQKKCESVKYVINSETVTSNALPLQNCFRGPEL